MGHPERQFRSVHVAGTNGKGSSSHLLAAVLQAAGYKVGLYTSPHLREFTERIRVNGQELAPDYLVAVGGALAAACLRKSSRRFLRCAWRWLSATLPSSAWTWPLWKWGWAGGSIPPTSSRRWFRSSPTSASTTRRCWATRCPKLRARKPASSSPACRWWSARRSPKWRMCFEREAAAKLAHLVYADQIYQATFTAEPRPETGLRPVAITPARPALPAQCRAGPARRLPAAQPARRAGHPR